MEESVQQVTIALPLAFQQNILQDLYAADGLVVLARGLGMPLIIANLLHALDQPGALVVLVGADAREEAWLGERMTEFPDARGILNVINSDATGVEKRERMYAKGGLFSITSRILIVDFLTGVLPPEKVSGIVVVKAEKVNANSTESFILRIFRKNNRDGFIKAFSDQPEPFATGFAPLASTLKFLFLRSASLWPRFHKDVAESLESRKADVIELEVMMTPAMRDIQIAILECIEAVMGELKKANSQQLDLEDWSTDAALHQNFDLIVRRQLDPVWHRVSFRSKQLVTDLSSLRQMLHFLLTYDCVAFNKAMETIFETNNTAQKSRNQGQSSWLFLEAANTIFTLSRQRVYKSKSGADAPIGTLPFDIEPTLEEQPKWEQLSEILTEIQSELHFNPPTDDGNNTVLIMCSDTRTCFQIKQYLETMHRNSTDEPSGKILLRRKFKDYIRWKKDFKHMTAELFKEKEKEEQAKEAARHAPAFKSRTAPPNKRRRIRGGGTGTANTRADADGVIDYAAITEELTEEIDEEQPNEETLEDMEDYFELLDLDDIVVVMPYDGDMDDRLLLELKPRHVVMYELDPSFIRRIEVYRATYKHINLRVYFLFYSGSVEEQRYLSTVRKEKDSFTRLIREKGNMALLLTHDGRVDDPQESYLRTVNTRIAGGGRIKATAEPPRVLVDLREFRSPLANLLEARNQCIVPCQLTVGDYILSPDICVERKSIKDLIQSFASGRLYNQCESMQTYYSTPVLLIEFDAHRSFTLDPFANYDGQIDASTIQSKLVSLSISFPSLRILWSSSPYASSEIFELLKQHQPEPDPIKCVMYGLQKETGTINQAAFELLESLPGISTKSGASWQIMQKANSVLEISEMSEREMMSAIGPENGRILYRFLSKDLSA